MLSVGIPDASGPTATDGSFAALSDRVGLLPIPYVDAIHPSDFTGPWWLVPQCELLQVDSGWMPHSVLIAALAQFREGTATVAAATRRDVLRAGSLSPVGVAVHRWGILDGWLPVSAAKDLRDRAIDVNGSGAAG